MGKQVQLLFLLLLLFISCLPNSIFKLATSTNINTIVCPEMEKEALLSFKQSLKDPSNLLSSWNNSSNCCTWKGVVCSNVTGSVHELHLQGSGGYSNSSLQGKMDSSLLQLKHLKYLDLSQNDLYGRIPSFMGSLTSLEYLNLSGAGFRGKIPPTIGNLSRLHTLDLEFNYGDDYYDESGLYSDNLEWLRRLSHLEHLNMNYVNLNTEHHLLQVIDTLPSLVELHLGNCSLDFMFDPPSDNANITSLAILDLSRNIFESFSIPKWLFRQKNLVFLDLSGTNFPGSIPTSSNNLTKLQHIDLSGNMIESLNNMWPIPQWIFEQTNLVYLDLSFSFFKGPIPAISNITKLQYIDLRRNHINSTIPDWLYSCKDLEFLSMGENFLEGSISNAIANLTSLTTLHLFSNQLSGDVPRGIQTLSKLQTLDLSENMLRGNVSNVFGQFESLIELKVQKNLLTGGIPINLGKLSRLEKLWLSDNRLTGNLPMSIGRLSELRDLQIENNMMKGVLTESHFVNLTKLDAFSASGNKLTLKLSPDWNPPFKLTILRLGSWNLGEGSVIPSWLQKQKSSLNELDLSNTGISGNVPAWFWGIRFLNLSYNHFSGNIPDTLDGFLQEGIYLNSNQFSGPLPRVVSSLMDINLSNNSFSGGISHFLCDLLNDRYRRNPMFPNPLSSLNLGGNQLTGEIPKCWMKFPRLRVLNLGDNNFSGSIPISIGALTNLFSLNLRNNNLSGEIPVSISNCTYMVTMDLSGNDLVGNIPTEIGTSLTQLRLLILRSNKLRGTIPWSICHLNSLQIFDLSNNAFFGRIPSCLNNLTAMTVKRNLGEKIGTELYYFGSIVRDFLESASISTKGKETNYDTILSLVNNINLSGNNLSGGIPSELTSLVELKSLNLSRNHLTGSIPKSIGDLKQLESLDLSRNALSGEMPNSFSVMSFLSYLNLSCNNLQGRIPKNTQFDGMDNSSFLGNDLCGTPLTRKCPGDDEDDGQDAGVVENADEDDKPEIEWFYVVLSLGYVLGLSAFCTTLVFKESRRAYFQFLECMWDKVYVHYHITCTKLMRRAVETS